MTQQEFQITHAGNRYETKSFTFPGGELQVSVPDLPERLKGDITVVARLQSADGLVKLLLLDELLGRVHRDGRRTLVVPYFPYARQDRVMQACEAFSLKAVARLVNGLGYDEVVTCDPHSDVTPALVENIRVVPQPEIVTTNDYILGLLRLKDERPIIVAPDAGAAKKASAVAQRLGLDLLTASKVRDTATGAITRTEIHALDKLGGREAMIVDDICDGGRTFIDLAKVLRDAGASRVYLHVTHGIFSKGLGVFDGLIDGVFTTDSFLSRDVEAPHLSPIPLYVSPLRF